jgi:V8-like Glu-specific endopeptidase
MKARHKVLLIATTVASSLIAVVPATQAKPNGSSTTSDKAVQFWTNARVRRAITRDFEMNTKTQRFELRGKPAVPGTIAGTSWASGGRVVQTTGKVLFSMGATYYVCSASVVNDIWTDRSIVLTAGHCVYDETNNQFADNWVFIPSWDTQPVPMDAEGLFCDSTEYGCWSAQSLIASNAFAQEPGFTVTATQHDYGFAVVGNGGFSAQQLDEVAGSQAMDTNSVDIDTETWAFGYPAQGKYKGNDLIYCKGLLSFDTRIRVDWSTYKLGCNMTGGSSGGPWMRDVSEIGINVGVGTVFSVTSYGYGSSKNLYGPILNTETVGMFAAAETVSGNLLYTS